jgi:limonene-1,2-epoxide hydrolase
MAQDVEFVVHQQAENPATGIVMNERTDRFKLANGRWAALRVMGVFELREGKILAWRDYFDMAEAQRELGF